MWNVKNKINTGEGNGNPVRCSCLENPRGGGAWWAAVYGVAQSWTRLTRLSSSSRAILRWGNKKKNLFLLCFCLMFSSQEKKNEMNKFYNKATYLSLWTKRSVLGWNGIKREQVQILDFPSNTGQWPLRGETNNLSPEVIPTLLPRVSRYLRKKYIIFIYIGMKSPTTFLGEKMGLEFPGSKAATLYLKRVE